jgi:thiol-disulfide isomerase/thioredoxin
MGGRADRLALHMTGVLAVVGALVVAGAAGLWLRRAPRRLASVRTAVAPGAGGSAAGVVLDPAQIGTALGERATLVQFSSAFCQPCRATRRILSDVSRDVPGVAYVDIDAESHLELVRRLDVRRTPTVLVLDAAGRVVRRASGQPRRVDVLAALGAAVSE